MRILILSQYFEPEIGAPQTRLRFTIHELRRLGHEVEVVTGLPNHPTGRIFLGYRRLFYRREEIKGSPVHRVWLWAAVGGGIGRLLNYFSFMATCLIGLARCQRPDILLVESPPLVLSLPAALAAFLWKRPFHFWVADLWPDTIQEMGLLRKGPLLELALAFESWSYRKATSVIAVTEGIRRTLIDVKGVPADKVGFLPNGVDTEMFRPRPPDPDFLRRTGLEGRRVILYAGTLGLLQGLDVAMDAVAEVALMDPRILLVLVGDGSDRKRLEEKALQDRNDHVRFLDPIPLEKVTEFYAASEMGLVILKDLPLFSGARPSKLFPIMASGIPVLYSGAGEGAALVTNAQAGLATPPGDVGALAQAMLVLLGNPALAKGCGERGRAFVTANFGWNSLVGSWLSHVHGRAALDREVKA